MPNVLVVEGNTRAAGERMVRMGERPYGPAYADVLRTLEPSVTCTIVHPCELGAPCLPDGTTFADFAGIAWTGSSLNIYDGGEAITNQLAFAERVLEAGLPVFGSCWGLQLFTVALGGTVRKNPRGREIGLARAITLNDAGAAHPMYRNSDRSFEALAVHLDEVETLPPHAIVLAGNAISEVQALAIDANGVDFWGVQYHPEFDCATMAKIFKRHGDHLVTEGVFDRSEQIAEAITYFESLHNSPDKSAPRPAVPRRLELSNWLREKVLPR